MHLSAAVQDRSLARYAERLRRLGSSGRAEMAATLNEAGALVRRDTVAAEARQTGLPAKVLEKAQRATPSTAADLSYRLRTSGGDVRLKYFGARESEAGVVAHPLGEARVFAHTFMKGGRFPDRVSVTKLHGQVFRRVDGSSRKIAVVRSGVAIPTEMVRGETAAAFQSGVEGVVARMVVTKLGALAP